MHGLNHDLTNISFNDVLPSVESVWDQLTRNNLLKENYYSINRAKNCLRALAFNLTNLDNQKVFKDKRKLQVIKELHKFYQEIRPKIAKIGRAHGLPKIRKPFERLPSFWPIIDTIGSTHYNVGKYITKLLNPLTQNKY